MAVSVRDLGAVGDGVTDDTKAIQCALDHAGAVYLPPGAYRTSSVLKIATSGQRLFGDRELSTIIASSSAHNGIAVLAGATHVTVEDFTMKGATTSQVKPPHQAILVNANATGTAPNGPSQEGHVTIRGMRFGGTMVVPGNQVGWNNAIHNNMSNGCVVENCMIEGVVGVDASYGYGILCSGEGARIINNNVSSGAPDPGVATAYGRHGIYLSYCPNAIVYGNVVRGFRSSGITTNTKIAGGNKRLLIVNNIILGCTTGSPYSDDAALGVYCQHPATSAGTVVTISGNQIIDAGRSAVFIKGTTQLVCCNNTISGFALTTPASHGIKLVFCDDFAVQGNVMGTAQIDTNLGFVEVETSRRGIIAQNVIRGTKNRFGVRLNTTTTAGITTGMCQVLDNLITANDSFLHAVENPTFGASFTRLAGV